MEKEAIVTPFSSSSPRRSVVLQGENESCGKDRVEKETEREGVKNVRSFDGMPVDALTFLRTSTYDPEKEKEKESERDKDKKVSPLPIGSHSYLRSAPSFKDGRDPVKEKENRPSKGRTSRDGKSELRESREMKEKEKEKDKKPNDQLSVLEYLRTNPPSSGKDQKKNDGKSGGKWKNLLFSKGEDDPNRLEEEELELEIGLPIPSSIQHNVHVDAQLRWTGEDACNQFKFLDKIGSGAWGVVYLAEHVNTKLQLAIKNLPMDLKSDAAANLRREIDVLRSCNHPNVVSYYGCIDYGLDALWVLMEYCSGGSVFDRIRGINCEKVFSSFCVEFRILSNLTFTNLTFSPSPFDG